MCLFLCVVINFYIYYVSTTTTTTTTFSVHTHTYVDILCIHTYIHTYIYIICSLRFTRGYFDSPRCCHLYTVTRLVCLLCLPPLLAPDVPPRYTPLPQCPNNNNRKTIIIGNAVNAGCIQSRVLCTCICISIYVSVSISISLAVAVSVSAS